MGGDGKINNGTACYRGRAMGEDTGCKHRVKHSEVEFTAKVKQPIAKRIGIAKRPRPVTTVEVTNSQQRNAGICCHTEGSKKKFKSLDSKHSLTIEDTHKRFP